MFFVISAELPRIVHKTVQWLPLLLLASSISAAPFAYITNGGSNSVSVIDTATNRVVATIPFGSNPRGLAIDSNGSSVYVTNFGSGTVSVIDVATNTVIGSPIDVGFHPYGIAVNPSGTRLYVGTSVSVAV